MEVVAVLSSEIASAVSEDSWDRALPPLRLSLLQLLRRRGVQGDVAEDIVQETLGRVWERCHQLKDPGRLASWARTIAMNILRSHRVRSRHFEPISPDVAGRGPGPLESLLREEVAGSVHQLLATICPQDEDAVLARHQESAAFRRGRAQSGNDTLRTRRRLHVAMALLRKWSPHTSAGRFAANSFGWSI